MTKSKLERVPSTDKALAVALLSLLLGCRHEGTDRASGDDNETANEDAAGSTTATAGDEEPTDGDGEPWEPAGGAGECRIDDLVSPSSYVRRVKNLLTGEPPTNAELMAVMEDPAAFEALVRDWIETDGFRSKMWDYMKVTLQQGSHGEVGYISQVDPQERPGSFEVVPELYDNLDESFIRTAMRIIENDEPFNSIASTRTWVMTTGMMTYLIAADTRDWGTFTFYHDPFTNSEGVTFNDDTPFSVQLEHRTFYSQSSIEGDSCGNDPDPTSTNDSSVALRHLMGFSRHKCSMSVNHVFQDSDFNDWRPVTMTTMATDQEEQVRYYDLPTLRAADTIQLRVARAGFFSTPSFLATWRTNEDNSFRVTTNQTLIVGLGLAFEDTDVTTPLGDDGLGDDHAGPGTDCYGCHKNLDPMRNFFSNVYYPNSYNVVSIAEREERQASFSFQGHTASGDDIADLGQIVSEHPAFAEGWTQKLCYYANSQACDADDPEFQRIARAFEDSNFSFKTLIVDLFSSRLVTGAACADNFDVQPVPTSVARAQHLCTSLQARLGGIDACESSGAASDLSSGLPKDAWARGSHAPNQPASPSLFYASSIDALCREIAGNVVDAGGSPLQTSDMEGSLDALVDRVMGLSPADPRRAEMRQILSDHLTRAEEVTTNERVRLRSAFVLACTSPLVSSTDL
ncbi:MAG: DUF1585 domain-containing protein [Myxococcota bacterium]